ncbi:MerR family transcriptional regulator [Oscillospiraceae bacterium WX1]
MEYTIKEVSEKFNLPPSTLRYYEKEGLIPSIQRGGNGHRLYNDTDLEWIQIVCCMRATGMSIDYVKRYIDLCLLGENTIPERRKIILCQKEIIENHISEYKKLLKVVNKKLAYYDMLPPVNESL